MLQPLQVRRLPNGVVVGVAPQRQLMGRGQVGLHPRHQLVRVPGPQRGGLGNLEPIAIPTDIKYVRIPGGQRGTEATLKVMKKLVMSPWGHRNPHVVMLANRIRDRVPSKDYRGEANALFQWVKANVYYKLDPAGLEWIQTPLYSLERKAGDCDDHSTLVAALAMASGHRAAFRTVKADPARPDQWSHVYAVIGVTKGGEVEWLAADSTQRESTLGWDPPGVYDMQTWVLDPTLEDHEWEF